MIQKRPRKKGKVREVKRGRNKNIKEKEETKEKDEDKKSFFAKKNILVNIDILHEEYLCATCWKMRTLDTMR
jgi:hypothetical protein